MFVCLVAVVCVVAGYFLGRPYRKPIRATVSRVAPCVTSVHDPEPSLVGDLEKQIKLLQAQAQAHTFEEKERARQEHQLHDHVSSLGTALSSAQAAWQTCRQDKIQWQEGYDRLQLEAADLGQQLRREQAAAQKAQDALARKVQAWTSQKAKLISVGEAACQENMRLKAEAQQRVTESHQQAAKLQQAVNKQMMTQQQIAQLQQQIAKLQVRVAEAEKTAAASAHRTNFMTMPQLTTQVIHLTGNQPNIPSGCTCRSTNCLQHVLLARQHASRAHAEAAALADAAKHLLQVCSTAKDNSDKQALRICEDEARHFFQEMQAPRAAQLLNYSIYTLEADYEVAASMLLERSEKARVAGTNFCAKGALQLDLSHILEQWLSVAGKNELGEPEQMQRLVSEAIAKRKGIDVGVAKAMAGQQTKYSSFSSPPKQPTTVTAPSRSSFSTSYYAPSYSTSYYAPSYQPSTPPARAPAPSSHQFSVGPRGGLKYVTSTGSTRYVSQNTPARARYLREAAGY